MATPVVGVTTAVLQSIKPPKEITVLGKVYERKTENIAQYATGVGNNYWMYAAKGQLSGYPHFMCTLNPTDQLNVIDIHYTANTYRIRFDCASGECWLIEFGEDRSDRTLADWTNYPRQKAGREDQELIDAFIAAMKLQKWQSQGRRKGGPVGYTLTK